MNKINFKKGFTLLEALVATSILMVAVAAPITIAQKGLSSAVYSKNQMIASYLAQDAIEYIMNIKDETAIANIGSASPSPWLGSLINCVGEDVSCAIDTVVDSGLGKIEPDKEDDFLYKEDTNGFYGYTAGGATLTNFKREINITETDPNVSALITATSSWNGGEMVVRTLIYNY